MPGPNSVAEFARDEFLAFRRVIWVNLMSHEILGLVRWQGLFFKPCVGDLEEVNMTGKVKVTSCGFFEGLLQHGLWSLQLFLLGKPYKSTVGSHVKRPKKSSGFSSGNDLPRTFQSFQEWRTRRLWRSYVNEENHGRSSIEIKQISCNYHRDIELQSVAVKLSNLYY